MKVKICGITRLEDARFCAGAGADYLGFIQHRESPRYVAPDVVREILSWVEGPGAVGVFVDADPDVVNRATREAGFAYVQLHGDEPPSYCDEMDVPVIKAIRVKPGMKPDDLRRRMDAYEGRVLYYLLDTGKPGIAGGTGETFDWSIAEGIAADYPLFLAGGLTPINVADAVEAVWPYGVDVSSGVESEPGVKDIDRLSEFFDAVRAVGA